MSWGIWDTKDGVWLGDKTGPKLFHEELMAKCAAQLIDIRMRWSPGRSRARAYTGHGVLRDEIDMTGKMSTLEALKRAERGVL